MAHNTNNPFVYDCGTCSKPVYSANGSWFHNDRHIACIIVSVVEIQLVKLTAHSTENLELVA
jgi:hypothetical protein